MSGLASTAGCVSLLICLLFVPLASANVIYVDDDATGANDGTSWTNAFRCLQDAFAAASSGGSESLRYWPDAETGTEIRVAQGVYRPDQSSTHPGGTRDRNASFCLLDSVAIRGGFAGVGTPDPNARDVARYESVLSGDLAGNDVPVGDPCDLLTEPTRLENSYSLVTAKRGCSRSAVLDGFTMRGAWDDALLLSTMSIPCRPSIRNCTFVGNSGGAGAAYLIEGTEPEFIACMFLRNAAWNHGGAIVVSPALRGPTGYPTGNPFVVRGCVFAWNVVAGPDRDVPHAGGAVCLYSLGTPSVIEGCTFVGNSAEIGGAIYSYHTVNITHCRFLQNTASQTGGAIYLQGTNATVASCTFSGNTTPHGRACYVVGPQAWLSVTNTILWDGGEEISTSGQVQVNATYCDVAGGWVGPGNIDADPLFADPGHWDPNGTPDDPNDDVWVDGDYHLKSQAGRWDPQAQAWVQDDATSLCIDAGDPNSPVGDEPEPNGGWVNMGAYGGTAEASKSFFLEETE